MTATLTITGSKRFKATIRCVQGCIGQAIDTDERLACKRAIRQARKWAEDRGVSLSIHRTFGGVQ